MSGSWGRLILIDGWFHEVTCHHRSYLTCSTDQQSTMWRDLFAGEYILGSAPYRKFRLESQLCKKVTGCQVLLRKYRQHQNSEMEWPTAADPTCKSAAWRTAIRRNQISVRRPKRESGVRAHVRCAAGDPTPDSLTGCQARSAWPGVRHPANEGRFTSRPASRSPHPCPATACRFGHRYPAWRACR